MLNKEEIEVNVLAQKIYRVEEYILEEIKQKGEISQFKEDVMEIIHSLLERQLSKEEQTACEIAVKNQEARIRAEKEKQLQRKIDQLESEKQKLIEKLKNKIRYFEENDELIATSNDNYSDGTVIKRFIDEFKKILEILKKE